MIAIYVARDLSHRTSRVCTMGGWSTAPARAPTTRWDEDVHELSIVTHLLEMVEGEAARVHARRVVDINLVIGERAHVVDDSLLFCFDLLAANTIAEGAQVHIRRTTMTFRCPRDGDYVPAEDDFGCPTCQEVGKMADQASELLVESIEVET